MTAAKPSEPLPDPGNVEWYGYPRWARRWIGVELPTRTNAFGAETTFRIGALVEVGDEIYRITRHKIIPTTPWATFVLYGKLVAERSVDA